MTGEAFEVDLGSLTDFAAELTTQLGGMTQPLHLLESLVERQLRLGAFGEAHELGRRHGDALAELHTLVSQARDAIDFAKEVTVMVGDSYRGYDQRAAGALGGLTGAITGTVGSVAGTVLSIVDPKG
ncbi:hypothetical protein [Actinophytocola oryzae]|uniref:Uncharacterized protein n=1 Tax=Actinophytocola oryzae TaxID=502181 RepID=A0A4R7VZK8_9PSEU|nr:hypothetical protein [Actinophytocola oryzae]TDV54999.1 hypothetical protein CLV71_103240 [Actinophytocola oryzae]